MKTKNMIPSEMEFFKFVIRQINYTNSRFEIIKNNDNYEIVIKAYFNNSLGQIAQKYVKKVNKLPPDDYTHHYGMWSKKGILRYDYFSLNDNSAYMVISSEYNKSYYDIIPHRVIKKLGINQVFYPVHTQNKKEVSYYEKDFFKFATSICNHKSSINEDGSTIITIESSMRNLINAYHFTLRATHAIITKEPSRNYLRKLLHKWNRQGVLIINNDSLVFKLSAYNCECYL